MSTIRNTNKGKNPHGFSVNNNNGDSDLFESISQHMKDRHDIEDVRNDPQYLEMSNSAATMVEDYQIDSVNIANQKFIKDIFSETHSEEDSVQQQINSIRKEIEENNLNDLADHLVKEWQEREQKSVQAGEITDFITSAMESAEIKDHKAVVKSTRNLIFVKYISFAAAAIIGAFILIRTLAPVNGTDKLYTKFYTPFEAISTVTRSTDAIHDNYSAAVDSYKNGDYGKASEEFELAISQNPSQESSRFLLGISQMELGNFSKAASLLSEIPGNSEYGSEARWYLGLAYLKLSEVKKARECFEALAQSEGYYHDRSEKILRRLK